MFEPVPPPHPVIEAGTAFGTLTVGYPHMYKDGIVRYGCVCSCGLQLLAPAEHLLSGKINCCNWEAEDPERPHASGFRTPEINIYVGRAHVFLLGAMAAEGGKNIVIDAAFLEKHNIKFRPLDPREEITDIKQCGLIREEKRGGWTVTARGNKWLAGRIRIMPGFSLSGESEYYKCLTSRLRGESVSISDILNEKDFTHA